MRTSRDGVQASVTAKLPRGLPSTTKFENPLAQNDAFQTVESTNTAPGDLSGMPILIRGESLWLGLRYCVSDWLPSGADAAGPGTSL